MEYKVRLLRLLDKIFMRFVIMIRNFLIVSVCFLLAISSACQSANTTNTDANTSANIPPEFSSSPISIEGKSIPGITDANSGNVNISANGTIPGIPDEETLKKQMNTPLQDVNIVNNPPKDDKTPNENSANQPKTVRKP
ncbi:MAG: hypothetical protein LC768_06470 [Acidobacteria bacterium]|nr:hypothetical protein [Acidobacteriota bacterium]MCA1637967.1 hypothetical protein [Acidobacteriota bacterium]